MVRLFVAIDLPKEVRRDLSFLCCGLPGARWVPEEQIHLTLRFIGEVDGAVFQDIKAGLEDVKHAPFPMRLQGLGFFPPRKSPRVLWAGIEKNDALVQLRNRAEAVLVRCGLAPETRKFAPHVTLARLTNTPVGRLANFLAGNGLYATEPFMVDAFHLYSSFLTSKGAFHQVESSYGLENV